MQNPLSESTYLPNIESYMDRASALELARRSLVGAPVYTFVSLIMLAGTPMLVDYGLWAVTEAVLLLMLGGVRVWFALGFERRYDAIGEKAVGQFSMLTALQSLTLGFLSAMVIWQYWATQQTILTIVLSAGCIAAGTSALSVRRSAQFIFLACVLAPFGVAIYLVAGLAQAMLITGFLSLMAFLVQDGGSAKRVYFQRLREHYGEEIARRRAAYEIRAKKEFIKDISLDIRAPVNSITGMASLLLDEKLDRKAYEMADTILQSANSLLKLIGDRPEPGTVKSSRVGPEVPPCALDLSQCIATVMDLYALEAKEKGLKVKTLLKDLPDSVISCDQSQIEQVLANLMSNAVRFTDTGSITLSSSSKRFQNGAVCIEFSLADTGIGFPAESRESVFSPFGMHGAKTSGRFGGDGLGLPMCKGLVDLMGGDIWIEDNGRRGSIVKFTINAELDPSHNVLELAEVKPANVKIKTEPKARQPGLSSDIARICPQRILVVDDDDIHRQITCTQLKKLGCVAHEAANGEEAISAVMRSAYDLVFMDMRMPRMNGIESSRWIRECFNGGRELRIIALTGDESDEAREKCLEVGMDGFINKPAQAEDLEVILGYNRPDQNRQVEKCASTTPELRSVH
jgi:signal transduction histidine kinase/ActR/RegA family two-component response regulator